MTYKEIATVYKRLYGKTIKTCWIADVKRNLGIPVRKSPNRIGISIKNSCPAELMERIAQIIKGESM